MQVNPPLWHQFATLQFDVGLAVHLHRGAGQPFGQAGQQIVAARVADHLANLERADGVARGDNWRRFWWGGFDRAADIRGRLAAFVAPGDKIPQCPLFGGQMPGSSHGFEVPVVRGRLLASRTGKSTTMRPVSRICPAC